MCLAVPARIVEIEGDIATINAGGVCRKANMSFIDNAEVGEYVLVHAGFAIKKWTEADVAEYNAIMNEVAGAMGGGNGH